MARNVDEHECASERGRERERMSMADGRYRASGQWSKGEFWCTVGNRPSQGGDLHRTRLGATYAPAAAVSHPGHGPSPGPRRPGPWPLRDLTSTQTRPHEIFDHDPRAIGPPLLRTFPIARSTPPAR